MKKTRKEINGMFVMNVMQVIIGMILNASAKHVQLITVILVNQLKNANLVKKDSTLSMKEKAAKKSTPNAPLMLKTTNEKQIIIMKLSYSVMNAKLIPISMKNLFNASYVQLFQIAKNALMILLVKFAVQITS